MFEVYYCVLIDIFLLWICQYFLSNAFKFFNCMEIVSPLLVFLFAVPICRFCNADSRSARITMWLFSYSIAMFWMFNYMKHMIILSTLTLSWGTSLSYQPINLQSKSMDWFLDDGDVRHERVKWELAQR